MRIAVSLTCVVLGLSERAEKYQIHNDVEEVKSAEKSRVHKDVKEIKSVLSDVKKLSVKQSTEQKRTSEIEKDRSVDSATLRRQGVLGHDAVGECAILEDQLPITLDKEVQQEHNIEKFKEMIGQKVDAFSPDDLDLIDMRSFKCTPGEVANSAVCEASTKVDCWEHKCPKIDAEGECCPKIREPILVAFPFMTVGNIATVKSIEYVWTTPKCAAMVRDSTDTTLTGEVDCKVDCQDLCSDECVGAESVEDES